jgi:hypothetical protein
MYFPEASIRSYIVKILIWWIYYRHVFKQFAKTLSTFENWIGKKIRSRDEDIHWHASDQLCFSMESHWKRRHNPWDIQLGIMIKGATWRAWSGAYVLGGANCSCTTKGRSHQSICHEIRELFYRFLILLCPTYRPTLGKTCPSIIPF